MTERSYITMDSDERKRIPMARGLLDYFPAALAEVAKHSLMADEKHNGPSDGQRDPTWARGKSMDHADCIMRHLVNRGGYDGPYRETTALAWRALAMLQEELEAEGALPGRACRFPEPEPTGFMLKLTGLKDKDKRIAAIKALRSLEGFPLGLKEAKDYVDDVYEGKEVNFYLMPGVDVSVLDGHFDYAKS